MEEAKVEAARLRAEAKQQAQLQAQQKEQAASKKAKAKAAKEAEEEAARPPSERLLSAASNCDLDLVRQLLSEGADARFISDPLGIWGSCDKKTALHCALMSRGADVDRVVEVVRLLLDADADPNAVRAQQDWRGCGQSTTAFEMLLAGSAAVRVRLLEDFIAKGADPNLKRVQHIHSMRTDGTIVRLPLHAAVSSGDAATVAVLLRAGAHVDAPCTEQIRNERGYDQALRKTALHLAVERGSVELAGLLLAEGADPNVQAEYLEQRPSGVKSPHDDPRADGFRSAVVCVPVRETALHIAVRRKNADLVRALLVGGADAGALRSVGDTQTQTADDLCDGDAGLQGALKIGSGWTPESHKYFGAELKERVRAVLLTAKANDWALPDDAMQLIFAEMAARDGRRASVAAGHVAS